MRILRKTRVLMGLILLAPGMAAAGDAEPVAPETSPVVHVMPAPMWPQIMPIAAAQPYFWATRPAMAWPMLPRYPGPIIMQPAMPSTWTPFVWVWVPVTTVASVPAVVDYGPVAETPVIELPLGTEMAPPEALDGAAVLPAEAGMGQSVAMDEAMAEPAASGLRPADPTLPVSPEPIVTPIAVPVSMVDYGPVAPTPVVDMRALEKQLARVSRKLSGPASKTAAPTPTKQGAAVVSKPTKKRMCWTNGVVAPCR